MKTMQVRFSIIFLFLVSNVQSQTNLVLGVEWGGSPLILDKRYGQNQLHISTVKFYVGYPSPTIEIDPKPSGYNYHLYSSKDSSSHLMKIQSVSDSFSYNLIVGVDSLTNMTGPSQGDLDPMRGMYWTWQSGYINVKIEGGYTNEQGQKVELTYHLGGFLHGHLAAAEIGPALPVDANRLLVDLQQFFDAFDYQELPFVMSPGPDAQKLSHLFAQSFTYRQ